MPATAMHPAERAHRRASARRNELVAWLRAAKLAAPITLCLALAVLTGLHVAGYRPDAARSRAFVAHSSTQIAAPAVGTTGTVALPAAPRSPDPLLPGAAAKPFSTRLATPLDRARALECLTSAVYYEAASESDAGQRAVAQVVLNRVRHPAFPATVCGVVYQGADKAGCQFSFACDGAFLRVPAPAAWARAARNAAALLGGQVYAPVGLATHYHTYAVTPAWNRTLVMTDAVGAHFFHRWKGFWGTAAAFTQRYRGHEPTPFTPRPTSVVAAILPARAVPNGDNPPSTIQPRYAESGAALLRDAAPDTSPPSQVLDRWKDSGKPLR